MIHFSARSIFMLASYGLLLTQCFLSYGPVKMEERTGFSPFKTEREMEDEEEESKDSSKLNWNDIDIRLERDITTWSPDLQDSFKDEPPYKQHIILMKAYKAGERSEKLLKKLQYNKTKLDRLVQTIGKAQLIAQDYDKRTKELQELAGQLKKKSRKREWEKLRKERNRMAKKYITRKFLSLEEKLAMQQNCIKRSKEIKRTLKSLLYEEKQERKKAEARQKKIDSLLFFKKQDTHKHT